MIQTAPVLTPELALRSALGDLRREAERLGELEAARWAATLDERMRSRRLLVAVVGEHNRGKSSLINSLIGSAWLPVGQAAPALPPVYVYGGAREHVDLVYEDGATAESTRAELLGLSPDDAASVSYARVALPSPDLYGLVLVDTPGLNDPDTSRLTQTVYGLLPRSDLALLVLDSAQALGASEHDLVEQRILHAGLHRLVVVLNRDDELEDESQRAAVRDRVVRMLTPLLGHEPTILPYAARSAVRARERGDTRLLARSGYPELRALLQESTAERMRILQQAVAARAWALGVDLRSRVQARPLPAPQSPPDTSVALSERAAVASRQLETVRAEYTLELKAFTIELRDRLGGEVAEASADDIRRFLPFYIQEQFSTFLQQHEEPVLTRLQTTLAAAGMTDLPVPPQPLGRPLAPGLHPYVAPDFLEDSLLITTLMQVAGLALPSFVATALMTLGPLLRRFTRNIRAQDEHDALLTAARAATMEAGAMLERQVDQAFAGIEDALRLAAAPPPPIEVLPIDDTERREATARVDAVLALLAPFGANQQLDAGRYGESHVAPLTGATLVEVQGSAPGDAESSPPDPVPHAVGAQGSAPLQGSAPSPGPAPSPDASPSHDGVSEGIGAPGDVPSHHDAPDGVVGRGSPPSAVTDDVGARGSAPNHVPDAVGEQGPAPGAEREDG